MTNYQSALGRIKRANTKAELAKLELSFCRVYDAGQLTTSELSRLSVKIMEKQSKLDSLNPVN